MFCVFHKQQVESDGRKGVARECVIPARIARFACLGRTVAVVGNDAFHHAVHHAVAVHRVCWIVWMLRTYQASSFIEQSYDKYTSYGTYLYVKVRDDSDFYDSLDVPSKLIFDKHLITISYKDLNIKCTFCLKMSHPPSSVADYSIVVGRGRPSGVCLLYTSPSPRDATLSRMPSSA